jgi:hypothetical protein
MYRQHAIANRVNRMSCFMRHLPMSNPKMMIATPNAAAMASCQSSSVCFMLPIKTVFAAQVIQILSGSQFPRHSTTNAGQVGVMDSSPYCRFMIESSRRHPFG